MINEIPPCKCGGKAEERNLSGQGENRVWIECTKCHRQTIHIDPLTDWDVDLKQIWKDEIGDVEMVKRVNNRGER